MSLVSIAIPTHNRENLIAETIKSAQNQTFDDIEIVVCDNNSNDNTFEIVNELARADSRIKAFRNNENLGPVKNWIECIKKSNSKYCKLLFSDDLISPNYLEETIPAILDAKCGVVYTSAIIGDKPWQGSVAYNAFTGNIGISRNAYIRTAVCSDGVFPVSPGAALFRKTDLIASILTELDGIENYDFSATGSGVDWLTYVLTTLRYEHIAYVNKPLSFFRAHEGSLSIKNENNLIVLGQQLAKNWIKSKLRI